MSLNFNFQQLKLQSYAQTASYCLGLPLAPDHSSVCWNYGVSHHLIYSTSFSVIFSIPGDIAHGSRSSEGFCHLLCGINFHAHKGFTPILKLFGGFLDILNNFWRGSVHSKCLSFPTIIQIFYLSGLSKYINKQAVKSVYCRFYPSAMILMRYPL